MSFDPVSLELFIRIMIPMSCGIVLAWVFHDVRKRD